MKPRIKGDDCISKLKEESIFYFEYLQVQTITKIGVQRNNAQSIVGRNRIECPSAIKKNNFDNFIILTLGFHKALICYLFGGYFNSVVVVGFFVITIGLSHK